MLSLFEFVKSQLNIVDLIAEYVPLKAAGFYMKGSCPFHSEKDASFTISPDKQIFYCFGCHASGDVIAFIAKRENLSQLQAAKFLIEKYNINLPNELKTSSKGLIQDDQIDKGTYFSLCKSVATWAHRQLLNDRIALEYVNSRGINENSINVFLIGYFPGGASRINKFLKDMASESILLKDLLEYGILMEGRSNIYSPFEERILFPIKNLYGKFCGFGGRVFKAGDDRSKYYNSRESEHFIKGKLLFPFDLAKNAMQEKGYGFLVEGYMDSVMMFQFDYKNTVATLGTACTMEHLKQLARHIKVLHVLYDGDNAGQNAILRLAEFCWEAKLDLNVVQLPQNEDPASLLQKGLGLEPLMQKSVDIFNFFIDSLGGGFQQKTLSEKLSLAEKIVAVISKISDSFKRDLLISQAAMSMNMPFESVRALLNRQMYKKGSNDINSNRNNDKKYLQPDNSKEDIINDSGVIGEDCVDAAVLDLALLEEKIFSATLNSELKLCEEARLDEYLLPYFSKNFQQLYSKVKIFKQGCNVSSLDYKNLFSRFLDSLESSEREFVIRVVVKSDANVSKYDFDKLVFRFCKINWKSIVQGIKEDMAKVKEMNDPTKLNDLLVKFLKLKEGMQSRGLI